MKQLVIKLLGTAGLALAAFTFSLPSHATTLDVQNGILMGAAGVEVNGSLYDVKFEDGSCNTLFNNCDQISFLFKSVNDAVAAGNALLGQVLVDGALGLFDSNQTLTNGCSGAFGNCWIYTPFTNPMAPQGFFNDEYVQNYGQSYNQYDSASSITYGDYAQYTTGDTDVFAVWSKHTSTVPEPASLALLGIGLVGMGVSRKRKNKKQAA